MDVDAKVAALEQQRKILTRIGIWGTALFGGMIGSYAYLKGGIVEMLALPLNNMGDFLAGAFAPLAFLWLVIGYRMQALELEQNSKALQAQVREMKNTVSTSKQNVLNQAIDFYRYELSGICHSINSLFTTSRYADRSDQVWSRYMQGDVNAVINELIINKDIILIHGEVLNYAGAYLSLFDKFMYELSSLDESGVFVKVFQVGPFKEARDILASTVAKSCEGQS